MTPQHLKMLLADAVTWNRWRAESPDMRVDLSDIDFFTIRGSDEPQLTSEFSGFDFSWGNLNRVSMRNCVFTDCNFSDCDLHFADLVNVYCVRCNFRGAGLNVSKIGFASFIECDFTDASLSYCSAEETNFIGSHFIRTRLDNMSLVKADFTNTVIDSAIVYGTSAWDLNLENSRQRNIYISLENSAITVPSIELAQFIAFLVGNVKIREVIETITSKVVLLLGRFTPERKAVLGAIRDLLQDHGYVPVIFDFVPPSTRDLTETVLTLASMARFVVVDLTDAKSVPQELATIVPHFPSVPVQPILQKGESEYALFEHLRSYPWVLAVLQYDSAATVQLVNEIVRRCESQYRAAG
jgi:uncharacterized protein YjbI with pentapeptide repeats